MTDILVWTIVVFSWLISGYLAMAMAKHDFLRTGFGWDKGETRVVFTLAFFGPFFLLAMVGFALLSRKVGFAWNIFEKKESDEGKLDLDFKIHSSRYLH